MKAVPTSVIGAPGSPTHTPAAQAGAGGTPNMMPVYVMAVGPSGQWQPMTYMVPHIAHPHYGYMPQYYKAAEKDG